MTTTCLRPRALFLGSTFAGHRTRFMNLECHARADGRLRHVFRSIRGWDHEGRLERLPLLPNGIKGRLRAAEEARHFAILPRPDVIWCSALQEVVPWLWSQAGPLRRPVVLDLDWTIVQQEAWSHEYFDRAPKRGLRLKFALASERAVWNAAAHFVTFSHWAADSLIEQGVPAERVSVIPPGVDLDRWKPGERAPGSGDGPLRLLFVGADFHRKGGDLLADLVRTRFDGQCELDIVTRDDVPAGGNVRVHRAEPNSPLLRSLYANADLFLLPSRAECFGIASVEAMASGLPAIITNVGGAPDIVDDGVTGWVIETGAEALAGGIARAIAHRGTLAAMGQAARRSAAQRFDGRVNDGKVLDLMVELGAPYARRRNAK